MSSKDQSGDNLVQNLRDQGVQYVVGATGQPIAVLVTIEEYEHYLDLLDDEADSQDEGLAARLVQAAARPTRQGRHTLRDYLCQREPSGAKVQG